MSQRDLERLVAACEKDAFLREQLGRLSGDLPAWRNRTRELGYDLTADEAESLCTGTTELSEDQLEEVAGGWDETDPHGGEPPPPGGGGGE